MTRRVLLLHGLWMRPPAMALLARRLQHAGFATERIGYASVRGAASRAVADVARAMREGPCDVVAHSLGGLVTVAALEAEPTLPVRRVVCLGSPLCGSLAAEKLDHVPLLGAMLGHSRELLHRGCRPWTGRARIGMVAGNRPIGLGRMLGRVEGENDGAVGVVETRLEGLADHVVIPSTHTGLIFSALAARQCIAFLRHGRFER